MDKKLSKDVLNIVNAKTGKSVSSNDVKKIASKVNATTTQSEAQLRKLIQQVGEMVNIKVSEKTTKEIINAVKGSGMSSSNMEQLVKMMMGKK